MSIFNRIFGGQEDDGESDRPATERSERETAVEGAARANGNGADPRAGIAAPSEPTDDDLDDLDEPLTMPDALPPPLPPPPGDSERSPRDSLLKPPVTVGGVRVAPKRNDHATTPSPVVPAAGGTPPRPTARAPQPARPSRPATAKATPPPPAPKSKATPAPNGVVRKKRMSSISGAFAAIVSDGSEGAAPAQQSAEDQVAVQQVFDELAANHVDQVRNVMLELQVGDVACAWVESSKATLSSLRAMAKEMDNDELVGALDGFIGAVDDAVKSGQSKVTGARKERLMERYQRLVELIPRAFALDGERDRREPVIVESLLRQVPGVEKITIDRLFAAGLSKLDTLMQANAGDMAAAAGIAPAIATRIAERMQSYGKSVPTAVAAQDSAAEHGQLRTLLAGLKKQHEEFESAAAGWSNEHRARKRAARQERERIFLEVRVCLARLGQTERLAELEKQPFRERINALTAYLDEVDKQRPPRARTARARTQPDGGPSLGT